jgi:hypothetical protein
MRGLTNTTTILKSVWPVSRQTWSVTYWPATVRALPFLFSEVGNFSVWEALPRFFRTQVFFTVLTNLVILSSHYFAITLIQQALCYYLLLNLTPFTERHNLYRKCVQHEAGVPATTQKFSVRVVTRHL